MLARILLATLLISPIVVGISPATDVEGQIAVHAPPTLNAPVLQPAVQVPAPPPQPKLLPPDPEKQWALLIGIGKFQGRTQPNPGSAGDALDMRQMLLNNGWRDDHIRVLTDGAATAANIRSSLQWLADQCGPLSACMFHYSGHVKMMRANDGDSEAVDEALWSHDNKFIPDGEAAKFLGALPSAWINISGCEAAGFNDNVASPTRLFTASSTETEKSYEHPDWKNSIFTGLLVDFGILQGRADENRDGLVNRHEAFGFASREAPKITRLQSHGPQHPVIAGGEQAIEGEGPSWLIPRPVLNPDRPKPLMGPCVFGLPCHSW